MGNNNEGIRNELLSRLPQPSNAAEYRREVAALLERNEKRLKREKWGTAAIWAYAILFFMAATMLPSFWHGGKNLGTPKGNAALIELGVFSLFLMIAAAVELLKHFINRARVELLREVKQTQLQVLELHELLKAGR